VEKINEKRISRTIDIAFWGCLGRDIIIQISRNRLEKMKKLPVQGLRFIKEIIQMIPIKI